VAGLLAAVAAAQSAPPTVAVTAGRGVITAQPAGPIASGPTRLQFTRTGSGDVEAYVASLRAGVSVEQLRRVITSDASIGLVYLEASATLSSAAPKRALTVDLRPSVTYVLVSQVGNRYALTELATTGTANGARAPSADARISMVDYAFRGAATLPRNGRIQVDNAGSAFHFAIAFPIRPGTRGRAIGRAFRSGGDRAIGRVATGPPVTVQNVLSPTTTNLQEVTFPRAGRYTLVCFFGGHNRFGMYRTVRVR